MAVDEYKTAEHVVACPSAVCETKCTASGATSGFHCFNTSVLMDQTAEEANERALAMGCVGSHRMGNMSMAGATHGDCLAGHNHNDSMATGDDVQVCRRRRRRRPRGNRAGVIPTPGRRSRHCTDRDVIVFSESLGDTPPRI
jgi:hypothetical protein